MRENRAFLLILILLTGAIAAVSLVIRRTSDEEEPRHISVVFSDSSADRWAAFKAGLRQGAEDAGVDIRIVRTGRFTSLREEEMLIENELASGADGIILQPYEDEKLWGMVTSVNAKVPVILTDGKEKYDIGSRQRLSFVGMDNSAAGAYLGGRILEETGAAPVVGVITGDSTLAGAAERVSALEEAIEAGGGTIAWVAGRSEMESDKGVPRDSAKVNVIAALDNDGLEFAADYAGARGDRAPAVYGIGNSSKVIYSLDNGIISGILVPDEFTMGYQSVSKMADCLSSGRRGLTGAVIEPVWVTRQTIFSEENETLLFPSVQ